MASNWLLNEKPLVIAHRGAKADSIENTLAAFALAAEQGADGIELDVQFSVDDQLVIFHDHSLKHVSGSNKKVADLPLSELKSIDLGEDQRIPTLDELFEMMGPRLLYNIELKTTHMLDNGLETAVADRVESFGLQHLVLISSFNPFSVHRARRVFSRSTAVALIRQNAILKNIHHWVDVEADHPHYTLVNQDYMAWCAKHYLRTHVWTVNNEEQVLRLAELNVHGIITDKPEAVRQILA